MKEFLVKGSIVLFGILLFHIGAGFYADGSLDPFYLRFTSPRQNSLILGASRAAQGIRPKIIQDVLKEADWNLPIYNFSFTIGISPYGPTYLNAIRKKLNRKTENGLFIVAVDPWLISAIADSLHFRERSNILGTTRFINWNPNFEYLIESYPKVWGNILLDKFKKNKRVVLKEDGWLDVIPIQDSIKIVKRIDFYSNKYRNEYLPFYHFSSVRLQYLAETVQFLNQHGRVLLVRIPVHTDMLFIENELMPHFDQIIMDLAERTNTPYLNYSLSGDDYFYNDGIHLNKESGLRFSRLLAQSIIKEN